MTLGSALFLCLVRTFASLYPGIDLQVTVANSDTITTVLCENHLDMALLKNDVSLPKLCCEPFGSDRLCAVLAPDHPLTKHTQLTLNQLIAYPLLLQKAGSTACAVLENTLTAQGLTLHVMGKCQYRCADRGSAGTWHREKDLTSSMQQFIALCRRQGGRTTR